MKDETRPNEDRGWSEAELEACIVAWVAGEATDLSPAELERIIAARPELANFKRRIELVRDLLVDSAKPESEPLRLAADRREKLLKTLGADAAVPSRERMVVAPGKTPWWRKGDVRRYLVSGGVAAGILGLLGMMTIPGFQKARYAPGGTDRAVMEMRMLDREAMPQASADEKRREAGQRISLPLYDPDTRPEKEEGALRVAQPSFAPQSPAPTFRGLGTVPLGAEPMSPLFSQGAAAPTASAPITVAFDAATPPKEEPVVKLDAFVVSEQRDAGYAAASSMAGTSMALVPPSFGDSLRKSLETQVDGQAAQASANSVANVQTIAGLGAASPKRPAAPVTSTTAGAITFSSDSVVGGVFAGEKKAGADANSIVMGSATIGSRVVQADGKTFVLADGNIQVGAGASITTSGGLFLSTLTPSDADTSALPKNKSSLDDRPLARANQPVPVDALRAEVATKNEPVSTFSLHVSDVSFRLAHAALMRDEMPEPARIRPEEFYNGFHYGDPAPTMAEKVACRLEQAGHPFLHARNLLRIAIKVPAIGRAESQPLRLTVLLDTSGSMEREDRAAAVQAAFRQLIALLGPNDRVTLIGFARQPRLLAEAVAGNQAATLLDVVARTPAEGGTNLEEALKLGGELARRHQLAGAQNRIVMLTDGAANLGDANPEQLARAIATLRGQGIAFDACGVGLDGLDDAVLEALTRRGDGRYYVLNSPEEADAGFARQIAGALRPAAENVKLQVRFNPARVAHHRLIGFDQHRLRTEDFRNDKVDAAELAAEEAAVALYQIEALPQGAGDVGEVFVRFRDTATGQMVERSWPIAYDAAMPAFDRAMPSIQLAGLASMLAERLRLGPVASGIKLGDFTPVLQRVRSHYPDDQRVQDLARMFSQARRLGVE